MEKITGSKIKSALGWNTGLNFFSQIITLVMSIVVARILSPEDYGIMAIGLILLKYVDTFTNFGFNSALIQKERINDKHINSVFVINLSISLILISVVYTSAPLISDIFKSKESEAVIKVLCSVLVLTSFSSIYEAKLKRELNFKYLSIVTLCISVLQYSLTLLLALFGFEYWALVIGEIFNQILKILFYWKKTKWLPKLYYNHNSMKYIYNFGMWNFIRSQIYFINRYVLNIVIGLLLNPVELGYFDKALSTSRKPSSAFGKKINGVMFSAFSKMQDNTKNLEIWFLNLLTIQVVILLPLFLGLFAVAPYFIMALLGAKWAPATDPLRILCVATFFSTCNGGYASFNIGIGNYKSHTLRIGVGSILFILISIVATNYGGIKGASFSLLLMGLIYIALSIHLIKKRIEVKLFQLFKNLFPYILCNLIMLICVMLIAKLYPIYSIVNMLILMFSGIFIYTLSTILINFFMGKSIVYPFKIPKNKKRTAYE